MPRDPPKEGSGPANLWTELPLASLSAISFLRIPACPLTQCCPAACRVEIFNAFWHCRTNGNVGLAAWTAFRAAWLSKQILTYFSCLSWVLISWTQTNITYEVCSNSIRIGIVVVVQWVGCVCNQSWNVRTCVSNSWHKLQVAAFAQLSVVGRGSNTCVYVIAICTVCESTEQRICIKFCFKIGKPATETYQLLQQA